MKSKKKRLDPIVKMALGIFLGGFCLIAFGMFLSRPDRTIPPYSIGAQEKTLVAVHLPSWTSDPEIESLIKRFGAVGQSTRDFGSLKIQPTTPKDPRGRYQTVQVLIFSDPAWAEPDTLRRYVVGLANPSSDEIFLGEFEAAVRAGYRADKSGQAGWIGPWNRKQSKDRTLTMQWVFQEPWKEPGSVVKSAPSGP